MADLRTAAQQALEALESADWYINQLEQIVYSDDDTDTHEERAKVDAAITALRAALAEPEPCQYPDCVDNGPEGKCTRWLLAECEKSEDYKPQRKPLSADETMRILNATAGHHWCDEAHIQRFRAAIERAHGIE